jgi:hypothetical protein
MLPEGEIFFPRTVAAADKKTPSVYNGRGDKTV